MAAYLEAGAVVLHTTARGADVLADDAPIIPLTIRTDGEYVWTGPVTYYVRTYGVAPDTAFLEHVRARDYVPRVPSTSEIQAAAAGVLSGDLGEPVGSAAADDHGVAPLVQAEGQGEADPARGAGDEDGVSGDVHASSLGHHRTVLQRAHIGGSPIPG